MMYEILKDFKGSQDGRFTEEFTAGTQVDLSDYLASCIPKGLARPLEINNKAIVTDGSKKRKSVEIK